MTDSRLYYIIQTLLTKDYKNMRLVQNLVDNIKRCAGKSGISLQAAFDIICKFSTKPVGLLPILAINCGKMFVNRFRYSLHIFPGFLLKLATQRSFVIFVNSVSGK